MFSDDTVKPSSSSSYQNQEPSCYDNHSEEESSNYDEEEEEYDDDNDDDYGSNSDSNSSIFTSKICDMFQSLAGSKTDACALACCGVWLWERNVFELSGTKPKSWRQRPILLLVVSASLMFVILWSLTPFGNSGDGDGAHNDDGADDDDNLATTSTSNTTDKNSSLWNPKTTQHLMLPILLVFIVAAILFKLEDFQQSRFLFRLKLAKETFLLQRRRRGRTNIDDDDNDDDDNDDLQQEELDLYLQSHKSEIYNKHGFCGCVRKADNKAKRMKTKVSTKGKWNNDEGFDFLSRLWNCVAESCCGCLCCCYLQCFGICAIAQEQRHITQLQLREQQRQRLSDDDDDHDDMEVMEETTRLLQRTTHDYNNNIESSSWQRDYITMESWSNYYPQILNLRYEQEPRFFKHFQATSILSYRMLICIAVLLGFIVILSICPVHYSKWEVIVLFATLLQPTFIWYFIHWIWNRFDISIDAVIKYFISGFVICTSMAILYEMLLSILVYSSLFLSGLLTSTLLQLSGGTSSSSSSSASLTSVLLRAMMKTDKHYKKNEYDSIDDDDDDADPMFSKGLQDIDLPVGYMIAFAIIGAFLNAFVVAALVEELCKYLAFWMVEHPDLEVVEEEDIMSITRASTGQHDTANNNRDDVDTRRKIVQTTYSSATTDPTLRKKHNYRVSLESRGAAITIAMMTVALGFACAENMLYVFVYAPPGLESELLTLFVRCIFPIHPLAAALQSIGVCRRDLERDPSIGVGHILFPGWILHGTYDFSIMAYTIVTGVMNNYNNDEDHDNKASLEEGSDDNDDSTGSLLVFCAMIYFACAGIVHYFKEAWAQRERLVELDRLATNQSDRCEAA